MLLFVPLLKALSDSHNSWLASYDVNKDGVKVAVLTFPKSAYRLGETVVGVVELNERTSRARVLKVGDSPYHCLV